MAKFSEILTIVNGKNQSKVENPNGQYPIYGSGGIMGYADDFLCDAETVVIGRKGSINKPIYVEEPFWNVDTAFGLVANRNLLLPKYLFYFCIYFDFEQLNTTVTIPSLTKVNLLNIEMVLPTLAAQQEIVDRLTKVDELIALRKEQLAKLDQLVKSRFIELFGDPVINPKSWETAPLSALIINANNGMARRGKDEDGNIVLRLVELQNGFIDYSAPNRICLNETEKKRYELVDNDFLFARVNGNPDYVGRCAVFKSIGEPVFHNDHIIRVHFDEAKINGCFMSVAAFTAVVSAFNVLLGIVPCTAGVRHKYCKKET